MTSVIEFELLKAWAAGIVDGEGCILIHKTGVASNPGYQIIVSISSMNPDVTTPIKAVWGGHWCNDHDRYIKLGLSKRRDYSLYFSRREAKKFLIDIFPYLKSKQGDALIVLKALLSIPDESELRALGKKRAPVGSSRALIPYYDELLSLRESRIPVQES